MTRAFEAPVVIPISDPSADIQTTRRDWLRHSMTFATAAAAGCVVNALAIEPEWLELVRRPLPIDALPSVWQQRTVLQLSDLHVGYRVSPIYLQKSFARCAAVEPDVVVLTGDFLSLNRDRTPPWPELERLLPELPRGRQATCAVLGNHDYGAHWLQPEIAERLCTLLRELGVQVLRNEVAAVGGLQFLGVDELWSSRADVRRALAALAPGSPTVALVHNPDVVDLPTWTGYEGWILAGHTHGGQCRPPFLPPPIMSVANRRYTAGEFDLYDGRRLYVNRGLGHFIRARFNCRPEATLFTLTAA